MEPRIQYAKTDDGVRIAFTTVGQGPPLVVAGEIADAHVQLVWDHAPVGPFYKRLSEKNTVVKFDPRGFGLSDRDVTDHSLEARLLDLRAVIERLALASFALLGFTTGGPLAITYAAQESDRVSRLVLVGSGARTAEMLSRHRATQVAGLIRTDWEMFLENLAAVNYGFGKEESSRTARFLAAAFDADTLVRVTRATRVDDVTALLPKITCPALVVHYSGVHYLTLEMARELVSDIPDSRLLVLDYGWLVRDQEVAEAILDFLAEGEREAKPDLPSGTAIILFADIVESTALTEEMGDAAFRAKARELDKSLRGIIRECAGTPVEGKVLGDGVLAVFTSARQAIECGLRCGAVGESVELQLHLGIHAGDVIREGNNVYGGAVNIAARIAGASAPGEVLVSDTVRGLARTSAGVAFEDRGEQTLKGVAEPQRLFAVRTREEG